jgi:hypothetical protein
MRGLDPRIHQSSKDAFEDGWIAGSSPAMTLGRRPVPPESGFTHTNHQPAMAVSMHTIAGLI